MSCRRCGVVDCGIEAHRTSAPAPDPASEVDPETIHPVTTVHPLPVVPVSEILRLAEEWDRLTEDMVAKNVTGSIMLKVMRARAKELRALAAKTTEASHG